MLSTFDQASKQPHRYLTLHYPYTYTAFVLLFNSRRIRCTQGTPPSPRDSHTATRVGNRMFVIGGWDEHRVYGDVHVLELDSMRWIQPHTDVPQGALYPRRLVYHSAVAAASNCIFVFGGYDGRHSLSSLWVLYTGRWNW